jgi:chemotaxis protein methyltransferase CheR
MTGISMGDSKRQLIQRRVTNRLKATGIHSIRAYMDYLKEGHPEEVEQFSNAVTTNLTAFFRENQHFEFLRNTILPEVAKKQRSGTKKLRIWSAGCSTGEEPYSIAMTLREAIPDINNWDAKILATDLDSDVLAKSAAGVYPINRVDKVDKQLLKKWFRKKETSEGAWVKASPQLQELITFRQLNLMHEWPLKGKFDLIFCRNVIIYFDKPTQQKLISRYHKHIQRDGYLILGHSESLHNVSDDFNLLGKTIYQRLEK